jgi:hypothetical protein
MPYIKQDRREELSKFLSRATGDFDLYDTLDGTLRNIDGGWLGNIKTELNGGDVNYILTSICHLWIKKEGLNYANIEKVISCLKDIQSLKYVGESKAVYCKHLATIDCVIMEFYRRVAVPYEDKKIEENGDIDIL